ncbi:MAG: anthranilate phosphoribosyltransferase [Bacteroidota bacterium]|nr:anthranilate phosphoribosyltransferase [Bacteroidota bacterium]
MKEILKKVLEGRDLDSKDASEVMNSIMTGSATESQIGAFLAAEKIKGETVEELTAFAKVMREKSVKINLADKNAIDMCGTGGDGRGTFNISTVASFVAAGAGVTVAKHGNKSVSSSCGSADLLKELGVYISIEPFKVEKCINEIGIGFMFAPIFHPAMKLVSKPRSELGVKTFFNILGPLTNPAEVKYQIIGAYNLDVAKKMIEVLMRLGTKKSAVLHSSDGLDEISLSGKTFVFEIAKDEDLKSFEIHPKDFGLELCDISDLAGGTPEQNANMCLEILNNRKSPKRDIVLLNAAYAIYISGKAETPRVGFQMAVDSLENGSALKKLNQLIEFTKSI